MKFSAKVFECLVVELLAIIGDDGVGKSKSIDDLSLEETLDLAISDVHQRFSLHPFGQGSYLLRLPTKRVSARAFSH